MISSNYAIRLICVSTTDLKTIQQVTCNFMFKPQMAIEMPKFYATFYLSSLEMQFRFLNYFNLKQIIIELKTTNTSNFPIKVFDRTICFSVESFLTFHTNNTLNIVLFLMCYFYITSSKESMLLLYREVNFVVVVYIAYNHWRA